jgi:hypothetical protein
MSCDNTTCCTVVVDLDLHCSTTALKTDLPVDKQSLSGLTTDRSKSKGCRHEVRSRIIPDSTEIDPEYVWGDEGPFND